MGSVQNNDDATAYRIYVPICALVALQLQARPGRIPVHRKVYSGQAWTDRRREPNCWSLAPETQSEVDRLLTMLTDALAA